MNPSPRAIEQSIEALKASPGTFQRLVEEYARIAHPQWFLRIDPRGRRSDDVTRKGWPDATSDLPEGTSALLEATHSESWERHLADDVQKAEEKGNGTVGAFIFAAWAKSPDPDDLEPYRQRLVALGIPRAAIHFIFRDQLINELSRPLFGRLWIDPLRLPASCLPFDPIERVPRLFGPEERPDLFAPRRSEYQSGQVFRPQLADTVEERLAESGWALLRGRGAAGKTTLAVCIALGSTYAGRPVYYVDLTDLEGGESEQAAAIETMATRGDLGVLFIVDNVHLAPVAASRIFEGWQELAGNGSRLLLLGRLVTSEPDIRGRADPLEALDREALELAIGEETLIGVYRRIAARFSGFREGEALPQSVTERWLKAFGGDLIAFSTAVAQRIRDLQRDDWELAPGDAQHYIEREYLEFLSLPEREGVGRLAALATLEIGGTAKSIGLNFSSTVLEKGWVLRSEHFSTKQVRYRLVHPGLGDLVLAALKLEEETQAIFSAIAAADSFTGTMIARRLSLQDRHTEARAILSVIAASPTWYSLSFGTFQLPSTVRIFGRYGVLTTEEIDQRFSSKEIQALAIDDALRDSLNSLSYFLRFAQRNLPGVFEFLTQALSRVENYKVLSATALRTPLHFLVFFLSLAKINLPDAYESICQALSDEENPEVLSATALRTPLGDLVTFLTFAKDNLPGTYKSLIQVLSAEENQRLLGATVLRTPLHFLLYFLTFAKVNLAGVYESIRQALSEEENQEGLIVTALRSSLHLLGSFLTFAKANLPGTYDSLVKALSGEERLKVLGAMTLRTPLEHLGSFLTFAKENLPGTYASLVHALSGEENLKVLGATALRTPLAHLGSFLTFAKENLPDTYGSLIHALSGEENLKVLGATALRTPLDHLGYFLSFAKGHLKAIDGSLTQLLLEEASITILVQAALSSTPDKLVSFLAITQETSGRLYSSLFKGLTDGPRRYLLANLVTRSSLTALSSFLKQENFASAVVEVLDPVTWQEWHLRNPGKGVEALPAVGRQLAKLGRYELATAPARGVMIAAEVSEWHRSGVQITTLSHAVRLAGEIESGVREHFLDRIATQDWLKNRYLWIDPGPLAGALFTLWYLLGTSQFRRFRSPVLLAVVERKISLSKVGESISFGDLISLAGVGGLIGLSNPGAVLAWQSDLVLRSAIADRLPDDEDATLSPLQVQLWLGLRQLAIHRRVPLRVRKEDGDRILQLWCEAVPEHEKLKRLKSWMLVWLERCAAAGWRLLRDETPF